MYEVLVTFSFAQVTEKRNQQRRSWYFHDFLVDLLNGLAHLG